MRGPVQLDVAATAATHPDALHPRTLVRDRALHVQALEGEIEVVLGDEDRHVTVPVVHRDRVPDHRRDHDRGTRPGLHDLLLVLAVEHLDLFFERGLDVRPLLDGPAHFAFLLRGRSVTKRSVRGFLRVFRPIAGLPQGVWAMPPTGDLASPPPCGWSRGDITTPRTCGRQPMRRLWPAPPILRFSWSMFPSCPTVARQRTWTTRMPPEGSRICAYSPSFATSCAAPPAARTSCAPRPGCNSTPWIWVPVGMCSSGRQFPTRASASGPETTVSPTLRSFGARM